mmetsp:Transcript_14732/g.35129  ORF Transcript_14732/g.35129 Transcript_14732/m.35129 type:complete len:97 (-) Transcript_14732:405-695(-)
MQHPPTRVCLQLEPVSKDEDRPTGQVPEGGGEVRQETLLVGWEGARDTLVEDRKKRWGRGNVQAERAMAVTANGGGKPESRTTAAIDPGPVRQTNA